jgi:hypothetical protein
MCLYHLYGVLRRYGVPTLLFDGVQADRGVCPVCVSRVGDGVQALPSSGPFSKVMSTDTGIKTRAADEVDLIRILER